MKVLSDQCLFIFAKISYFFRSENSIIYTIYEHILYIIKRKEMVLRIRFPEAAALSELPLCLALPCAEIRPRSENSESFPRI